MGQKGTKGRGGKGGGVVLLEGSLTVAEADGIRKTLLAALRRGRPVQVRFGEVTEADLSLLQLLCSASIAAIRRGIPFALDDARLPEPVSRAMAGSGIIGHRGCPEGRCLWPGPAAQCAREVVNG